MFKRYSFFILLSFIFSYEVGDIISLSHQNTEYDICYGSQLDPNNDGVFKFSEYNGDMNKGNWFALPKDVQTKILKEKLNSSDYRLFRTAPGRF